MAVADYARCGLGEAEIRRDLVPIAQRSGLPDKDDPGYFDRQIRLALANISPRRTNTARVVDWQRALAFVQSQDWTGRTGNTDRAIAVALIDCARTYSNENGTFRASYREIGGKARVTDRRTIRGALDRLKAIPLVCYAGQDKTSGATLWRFSDHALAYGASHAQSTPLQLNTVLNYSRGVLSAQSDASERGALGKSGDRVWSALHTLGHPSRTAEIARESGLTIRQVQYALQPQGWLRKAELVTQVGRGLWVATPATNEQLDELVARPSGKLGMGEKRKRRFADERAIRAGELIMRHRLKKDWVNLEIGTY